MREGILVQQQICRNDEVISFSAAHLSSTHDVSVTWQQHDITAGGCSNTSSSIGIGRSTGIKVSAREVPAPTLQGH